MSPLFTRTIGVAAATAAAVLGGLVALAPSVPASTPAADLAASVPAATATATATKNDRDTFAIAVIPDTQAEVNRASDKRFAHRTAWLATNKARFDIRYVLHTGDVTNWGWLDPPELTRAKHAMSTLTAAGLQFAVSIGNHDTSAVGWNGKAGSTGYGGSAYMSNPECRSRLGAAACKSWLLVRKTSQFNATFPLAAMGNVGGAFETGRSDNYWTSFTANRTKWLVLTLELWPRKAAVAWARKVVATHPTYNVIIQTHHYLDGNGSISRSNGGYGATAPKHLYDRIVSKYSNVKLVFSGHTGTFTSRTNKPRGNTVVSFLGNDLGNGSSNPVRIVTINTRTGAVASKVYDPIRNRTVKSTSNTISIVK